MKVQKIWFNGKLVDWQKAQVHILTHTLHYGSGIFEGIRAYKTKNGPAVFRLNEHVKRFFYSAKVLKMKLPYSEVQIKKAILNLIKTNKLQECYIRPIAFFGEKMGLNPIGAPLHVAIAAWPWGKYLEKDYVSVKISKFMRIHPDSSDMAAKLSGHYLNSILASLDAKENGFDEALLLDEKGNIAEGPGENIFFIKSYSLSESASRRSSRRVILVTPKEKSILPGITRNSVITISKDLNYKVIEKDIKPGDLKNFDAAFFTGTAVEITPIGKINNIKFKKNNVVVRQIRETYSKTIHGEVKRYGKWLDYIT